MAEDKFPLKVLSMLSIVLILGALALWVSWGAVYNGWNLLDKNYIGLYSVVIVMLFLGIFGFLLIRKKGEAQDSKK
jgi:hypothetical protein